ncbi:MAG: FAD-binding protein [Afipia sp.]|nr:FAD-binding protein [Afipia sp.]
MDKAAAGQGVAARLRGVIRADRIMTDPVMTYAYSGDASHYRLEPAVVVIVNTEDEVRAVIAAARAEKLPLTFRAAGTSLSGPGDHRMACWRCWATGGGSLPCIRGPGSG